MPTEIDEYQVRIERLKKWQEAGVLAYPSKAERTHLANEVKEQFNKLVQKEAVITVAGRIRALRLHGASCFAIVEDDSSQIQVYAKQDVLGDEQYLRFSEWLDVGDFIQVSGTLFTTKTGEQTIQIKSFVLLAKALLPLPAKWHGLSDVEQRYRYRYLDLLSNKEVRRVFNARTKIITYLRKFLDERGFWEVDTPILQTLASGAVARPFKTHHDALDMDMFLRVAPELYLKRLLIGGYEKVYEVARCFRNEGIDYSHNPEFTQVELYWAYADYNNLMQMVEEFTRGLLQEVNGDLKVTVEGHELNFEPEFARLDFVEAFTKYLNINLDELDSVEKLSSVAVRKGMDVAPEWGRGKLLDELYKAHVRPRLIQPTFIINHPVDLSPLAKKITDRPNYTERMQLVVAGKLEMCNGFSELNDPLDQIQRFTDQKALQQRGDDEVMAADESFVEALKVGMPPAAGLGIGIDRLVAMVTGQHNLKDVILFPTLRAEQG
jgi:lysyl-tRNA synthetase class 2